MKNNIIKFTPVIILLATLIGCQADKQQQLVKLKKQQQEINAAIAALETELNNDPANADITETGTKVVTTTIQLKPFAHFIEVQGKLDGEENVMLFPKGQGVVKAVYTQIGATVKKGQVLAQLDDAAYLKTLEQTRTQYNLAKELFERQSRLWEQKIGSEIQYLQAKTQKEALESALGSLEEQVDYMKIKSPINGTVEDLPLKVGMAVSPAMPVATIINFASLKVVAEVAEAYGPSITPGDSVALFFPDLNAQIATTIATASKYISPVNRSFKVEAKIPGSQQKYKANMIAVLKIADYKKDAAVSVPINLIQTDSKGNYVYTVMNENGQTKARKKYISQGLSYNGIVEVVDGLADGDVIITNGHLALSEGALINL